MDSDLLLLAYLGFNIDNDIRVNRIVVSPVMYKRVMDQFLDDFLPLFPK